MYPDPFSHRAVLADSFVCLFCCLATIHTQPQERESISDLVLKKA